MSLLLYLWLLAIEKPLIVYIVCGCLIGVIAVFFYFVPIKTFDFDKQKSKKAIKKRRNQFLLSICPFILITIIFTGYLVWDKYVKPTSNIDSIYEINNTYSYLPYNDVVNVIFMVCYPPSDNENLQLEVKSFLDKNDVIQNLRSRMSVDFQCKSLYIYFVKPSKDFPIGWNEGEGGGFITGSIMRYHILSVSIPWDAGNNSEPEYIFPKS